ncbi:hypothetical protein CYMTET_6480 [Cymbomonas tetramitiformis]|uniref:Uncharacterized protein n=1 Tax=Cymbomonas tetramitiformis TaxID=36881 RepID=A0AAE0GXG7_9CHLO|nr:hypothetical protein CYMTET_6480 [Cymbomonas tetramitiformis]
MKNARSRATHSDKLGDKAVELEGSLAAANRKAAALDRREEKLAKLRAENSGDDHAARLESIASERRKLKERRDKLQKEELHQRDKHGVTPLEENPRKQDGAEDKQARRQALVARLRKEEPERRAAIESIRAGHASTLSEALDHAAPSSQGAGPAEPLDLPEVGGRWPQSMSADPNAFRERQDVNTKKPKSSGSTKEVRFGDLHLDADMLRPSPPSGSPKKSRSKANNYGSPTRHVHPGSPLHGRPPRHPDSSAEDGEEHRRKKGDAGGRMEQLEQEREVMRLRYEVEKQTQLMELERIRLEMHRMKSQAAQEEHAQKSQADGPSPMTPRSPTSSGKDTAAASQRDKAEDTLAVSSAARSIAGSQDDGELQVEVRKVGPIDTRGALRVEVGLFVESVPSNISDSTTHVEHSATDALGIKTFAFRQRLTLRNAVINPNSILVLQIFRQRVAPKFAFKPRGQPRMDSVVEADKRELVGEEEMICWTHMKLLVDGEIPSGKQRAEVYYPPVMVSASRKFPFARTMVEVEVAIGGNMQAPPTPRAPPASDPQHQLAQRQVQEDIPGVPAAAWRRVRRGVRPEGVFQDAAGFIVCVDCARFLPQNATVSKIVLTVTTSSNRQLDVVEAYPQPDSSSSFPIFGMSKNFDTLEWHDASVTLMFQVNTIERSSGKHRVIGYTALEAFIDPATGKPPGNPKLAVYSLNEGAFQLPLHNQPLKAGFTVASVAELPRVLGASLLVRVLPVPRSKKQMYSRPYHLQLPDYADGIYDSTRCIPTDAERRLYSRLLERPHVSVRAELALLARREQRPPPDTDAQCLDALHHRLKAEFLSNEAMLNFRHAHNYQSDLGFHIALDGFSNTNGAAFAALHSIAPPAPFYTDDTFRISDGMHSTRKFDLESPVSLLGWTDGFTAHHDVMYNSKLVALIDLRSVDVKTGIVQQYGWSLLPIFEEDSEFIASGHYQLPIFRPPVSAKLLDSLATSSEAVSLRELLATAMSNSEMKLLNSKQSVFVRLLDDQRLGELPEPASKVREALELPFYLNRKAQAAFVQQRDRMPGDGKVYKDCIPSGMTAESWIDTINTAIGKTINGDG